VALHVSVEIICLLPQNDLRMVRLPGRDGSFSRAKCLIQMDKDSETSEIDYSEMVQFAWDTEGIP